MRQYAKKLDGILRATLASKRTTWVILGLFVLQALWVAISFRQMYFDEGFHIGIISIYTDHWWPVIYNQPETYDRFRDFAGEGSKLFHYLLSYPQRVFDFLEIGQEKSILFHRLINIGLVTAGLYFFARLFDTLKVKRTYTNITLLLTTSLPILVLIAATVNYDNALFFLAPLFFLYFAKIVMNESVNWYDLGLMIIIGMVASLVKFTFLQLFATAILMVIVLLYMRHKRLLLSRIYHSFQLTGIKKKTMILIPFLLVLVLFIQTYALNVAQYGTPRPSCERTLGLERCKSNGVIKRNTKLLSSLEQRDVMLFPDYTIRWVGSMVGNSTSTHVMSVDKKGLHGLPLPIYKYTLFFGSIIGLIILAYSWRELRFSFAIKLLWLLSLSYLATILMNNYMLHMKYHAIIAIQSRYVLIVIPIVILLIVIATKFISRRRESKTVQTSIFVITMFLLVQGGGAVTHIVRSNNDWYRDNQQVRELNQTARSTLRPVVKEN